MIRDLNQALPFRMFTSRAEFRLHLRPDNADSRLTSAGYHDAGCVTQKRFQEFSRQQRILEASEAALRDFSLTLGEWRRRLPALNVKESRVNVRKSAWEILKRNEMMDWAKLEGGLPTELRDSLFADLSSFHCGPLRLQIACLYEDFVAKQIEEINQVLADEQLELPEALDYAAVGLNGLSAEVVEKLELARPATLGAASRIQGVTPAALVLLMKHVKRKRFASVAV